MALQKRKLTWIICKDSLRNASKHSVHVTKFS